jgi:hypothetical protein
MIKASWSTAEVRIEDGEDLFIKALGTATLINPMGSRATLIAVVNGSPIPIAEGGSITAPLINGIYEIKVRIARYEMNSDINGNPYPGPPKANLIVSYAEEIK